MEQAAVFEMLTTEGEAIPLTGVRVDAVVKDTSIETVIRQEYSNQEKHAIEAVYTFPLPVGATLLSLNVGLNGQQHAGVVVEAKQAEEQYEEAITDGDTAMRLQQVDDSLFTLNLGNLQQNDIAIIEIHYVQLLHWQDDHLRLMIPTTLGPRYGNPLELGMQPHQVPSSSLAVTHLMDLTVRIEGDLAKSKVSCPSHGVSIQAEDETLCVRPANKDLPMDRDFVLLIQRTEQESATAYYDVDLDGRWVAWVPVNPRVDFVSEPKQVKIVVDCSGSMAGTSIQQAKIALREIIDQLRPEDSFTVINFGSSWRALFKQLQPASDANKRKAYKWITKTDADLGGTEIEAALDAAYRIVGKSQECDLGADVLLITDGQTYDVTEVCKNASNSGHRHFTVGVGSAVAEDLVRGLADKTGGACELVTPNEDMALSIVRHFNRMYLPPVTWSEVVWPHTPMEAIPTEITHAFSGDTLHLFAVFDQCPQGAVAIKLTFGEAAWSNTFKLEPYKPRESEESTPLSELTLARLGAAQRITQSESTEEKVELGIKYQLQSSLTNYLVIVERDVKDESAFGPELRQVPSMLPAGWGGTSSFEVMDSACFESLPDYASLEKPRVMRPMLGPEFSRNENYSDIPMFLRRQTDSSADDFANNLEKHYRRLLVNPLKSAPRAIDELVGFGLDDEIVTVLFALVESGYSEQEVVAVFLYLFSQAELGQILLPRFVIRSIRKAFKKGSISADLCEEVATSIARLNDRSPWLPKPATDDSRLMY
ncbi:VIT and vWA domain-containing protein [Alkalimarinus alittae]|uniref:VIT and VWA domain-containing protein n=1 Tax=Alkalimarinus alittae TaxID=2961619 RepID=A0ABY6N5C4_9ALTE|nr:VIT and VWA domain-containing protein [Alkalimarinus alittae]UZE97289.1 VIT and VWA domain-containing protein [Alkalimarinus alittae]